MQDFPRNFRDNMEFHLGRIQIEDSQDEESRGVGGGGEVNDHSSEADQRKVERRKRNVPKLDR